MAVSFRRICKCLVTALPRLTAEDPSSSRVVQLATLGRPTTVAVVEAGNAFCELFPPPRPLSHDDMFKMQAQFNLSDNHTKGMATFLQ